MTLDDWKLLETAACGFGAALTATMARSRRLRLPHVYAVRTRDGEIVRFLDLGFLVAPLLGAFVALLGADLRAERALAYGLAVGYAGPAVLNALIDPILRRFGIDTEGNGLNGHTVLPVAEGNPAEITLVPVTVAGTPGEAEEGR